MVAYYSVTLKYFNMDRDCICMAGISSAGRIFNPIKIGSENVYLQSNV